MENKEVVFPQSTYETGGLEGKTVDLLNKEQSAYTKVTAETILNKI